MQQNLCLWLCVVVLFGALCTGNPFLPSSDAQVGPTLPAGDGAAGDGGSGAPAVVPPGGRAYALEVGSSRAAGGAVKALAGASAVPAAMPVALRTSGPAEASSHLCPDHELRPLVVATERGTRGETVWVLGDGRRFVRNPRPAAGQPVLVPLVDDVK